MRFRLPSLALISTLVLIAGCTTVSPEQRRAADEDKCRSYGFRQGTDAFATCLQRIDLDRRADARAFRASNDAMMWGWNRPVVVVRQRR